MGNDKDKSSSLIKDKSSKDIKDKDKKKDKSKDKEKDKDKSSKSVKKDKSSKSVVKDKDKDKSKSVIVEQENKDNIQVDKVYEQCEGCYSPLGEAYCSTCELVLCKACEEQIHIIPANQNHEKFELHTLKHVKKHCYHHKISLQYYCESCDEPICRECSIQGPHNTKLHRIVNVIESFKNKHSFLSGLINKSLSIKLDSLENQLQFIENITRDIRDNSEYISKEINNEYMGYSNSLKDQEGKKLALIQYNYNDLVTDISSINDIMTYFNKLENSSEPDITEFLLKYKQITETIESILNKKPRDYGELEVCVDDFTNHLEEDNKKLEKYEKLQDVLKVKDDIIWNLINESKTNIMSDEFFKKKQEFEHEIEGWAKLSFNYLTELKKFNKVCSFCGVKLDFRSVNSTCSKNNEEYSKSVGDLSLKTKYCDVIVPSSNMLNGYHFFAEPSQDYENKINKTLYSNHIINKSKEKILETDILVVFDKMRKRARGMRIDIEKDIMKFFNKEKGVLDHDDLKRYLINTYELNENEVEIVLKKLVKKQSYNYRNNTMNSTEGNNIKDLRSSGNEQNSANISEIISFFKLMKGIFAEEKIDNNKIDNNQYSITKNNSINYAGDNNLKSSTSRFQNKNYADSSYPVHNSLLNSKNTKRSLRDVSTPAWVIKVASGIDQYKLDLLTVLSQYDTDKDGFITPFELRSALGKLNLQLTEEDVDMMFGYFEISHTNRINIKEFSSNFVNKVMKKK